MAYKNLHSAVKVTIAGVMGASIWAESADNAAALIVRYSKAIAMAHGNKLARIGKNLRRIDPEYTRDIQEILLDRNLGNPEKLEFLRLKIDYALKNLRGRKRTEFSLAVIAAIAFAVGTNFISSEDPLSKPGKYFRTGKDSNYKNRISTSS